MLLRFFRACGFDWKFIEDHPAHCSLAFFTRVLFTMLEWIVAIPGDDPGRERYYLYLIGGPTETVQRSATRDVT